MSAARVGPGEQFCWTITICLKNACLLWGGLSRDGAWMVRRRAWRGYCELWAPVTLRQEPEVFGSWAQAAESWRYRSEARVWVSQGESQTLAVPSWWQEERQTQQKQGSLTGTGESWAGTGEKAQSCSPNQFCRARAFLEQWEPWRFRQTFGRE